MAQGVLVFDDGPVVATVDGDSGQSFIILDETNDVLVFDAAQARKGVLEDEASTDFIVFDTQAVVTETLLAPADFLLVDPPKQEARVVLEGEEDQDILVLTPGGPPGPQGVQGEPGPQGQPGLDGAGAYYEEFGFASPATTWTVVHNQGTFALSVETVDLNGDPLEGYVRYVDINTIEVDWYYPTAGAARVFR